MCLISLVNSKIILYLPMFSMRALRLSILSAFGVWGSVQGFAQDGPAVLAEVRVFSDRIANQASAGAFAMPVSALRYEPQVDVQTRNLGEAQADLTIRGGTFESVGVKLGGISLSDPQTGHYLAEIPVALDMLANSKIVTGAALALDATNATSGAVAYSWRPITAGGVAQVTIGDGQLFSTTWYQAMVAPARFGQTQLGADVALAHSSSEGLLPDADHAFDRVNIRLQAVGSASQTDVFAGYQSKQFGWRNLYTPFQSPESENLQTLLFALNHRAGLLGGDYLESAVFYRRNKDDYAYNRYAALTAIHPFQHTTWLSGAAISGRRTMDDFVADFRGEVWADEIESTSLLFGRYQTRTVAKASLAAEKFWMTDRAGRISAKVGATLDDSNRFRSAVSPVIELAREWSAAAVSRLWLSFSRATQLPSYTALNSNPSAGLFRGNAALGRERTANVELGIAGGRAGWTGDAVLFYRADSDLVDWTYRRGVTARSANAVNLATSGLELVARRSWAQADVIIGFNALAKAADYRGAAMDASFYALNYARYRLTAALVYRFNREWELRLDNAARLQADNALRLIGGDETLISSWGLSYRPRAFARTRVTLRADNVWNSNYQEVPAVTAAPRLISIGLTYGW